MSGRSWEEELIADLKARAATPEDAPTELDVLGQGFEALADAFEGAIARIAGAIGVTIASAGARSDHRLRWHYGSHSCALRLDGEAGKIFLSADVGTDVLMDELTARDGVLVDARQQAVDTEGLARRFVSLLFRGG